MENFPISDFNFFLFVIPGFVMVWSFRKFTSREVKGDFELLGLSAFLGLMNLVILELISKEGSVAKLLQNVYSATLVLCIFSIIFAYIGAWVVLQREWKAIKKFFQPRATKFPNK